MTPVGDPPDSWEDAPVPATVPVLPVSDLLRAVAWYQRLGFTVRSLYGDAYAILGYQGAELHLGAQHGVDAATSLSGAYLRVHDAAAVHARWIALGAREVAPVVDQPYGIREFATEDLDGNLWRVGSPIPGSADALAADEPEADAGSVRQAAAPPTDGTPGTDDSAWYGIVVAGPCAGCGLDAAAGSVGSLAGRLRDEAHRWGTVLAGDDDALRVRPEPDTWSALEYAAHVRDALAVFTERAMRTLAEDEPELGWWDHEAAIAEGWANEAEAAAVADDLARNAAHLGDVLDQVPAEGWSRRATRRGTEPFTIELLARFALHETVHHRVDAERGLQP